MIMSVWDGMMVECDLAHLWSNIIYGKRLMIQVGPTWLCKYHQIPCYKISHWNRLLLTASEVLYYLNILEIFQNLTKKSIIFITRMAQCSTDTH